MQWFPSDFFLPIIELIFPWFFDIFDQMKEFKNLSGQSKEKELIQTGENILKFALKL